VRSGATADKVDYLYSVIGLEHGSFPMRAADDVLIEFYCDLFGLEIQTANQLPK
jgi:hypothetical protein